MKLKLIAGLLVLNLGAFAQLPNRKLTPGAVRTTHPQDICSKSFRTGKFRKTTYAMKKRVCRAYGVKRCPWAGEIELDHLIPLELGGADEIQNLWPEFSKYANGGPGFHVKDLLENRLRSEVCAGRIPLSVAQQCIAKNWVKCSRLLMRTVPK